MCTLHCVLKQIYFVPGSVTNNTHALIPITIEIRSNKSQCQRDIAACNQPTVSSVLITFVCTGCKHNGHHRLQYNQRSISVIEKKADTLFLSVLLFLMFY